MRDEDDYPHLIEGNPPAINWTNLINLIVTVCVGWLIYKYVGMPIARWLIP